jgi:hypothetical protein
MKLLVSGSTRTVAKLAHRWPDRLGHLLTPNNRNGIASLLKTGLLWAADNGAFAGFDVPRFRRLLRRIAGKPRCLFVVCPDVVGNARATLELFWVWHPEVEIAGPTAFVGQDGAEDLALPWKYFSTFFIGGSTRWKLSQAAADLAREAKRRGKHVHMGRVNSRRRMQSALDIGCDSIDGSSASMYGDKYIHKYLLWLNQLDKQRVMFKA